MQRWTFKFKASASLLLQNMTCVCLLMCIGLNIIEMFVRILLSLVCYFKKKQQETQVTCHNYKAMRNYLVFTQYDVSLHRELHTEAQRKRN